MTKKNSNQSTSTNEKKTVFGAFIAFFVDMTDVYLPVIALAPALIYFEPESLSKTTSLTLYYMVFALSLIGRPLGSVIFGHFGDKIGRRKTTLISVAGFGITTFIIALLPGYEFWGLWGIVLLTIFRLIDGIFLGGEYTAANPLAMEYSPKNKRGFNGALINTGFPAGIAFVSIITTILLYFMSAEGVNSSYVVWGWRIPFIFAALLSGFLFYYYYKQVPESEIWKESGASSAPLKELFKGKNMKVFMQVFIVMSGAWFTLNAVTTALPGVLSYLNVNDSVTTNIQLFANVILVFLFVPVGMLGQKIGRKTILILIGIVSLTLASFLFYLLVSGGVDNTTRVVTLGILITIFVMPIWAIVTAYITERFHTGVRASGYGIGYSLAVIIPSFMSFYMLALDKIMPYEYTQIVFLVIGGLLIAWGALLGPETKDTNFESSE